MRRRRLHDRVGEELLPVFGAPLVALVAERKALKGVERRSEIRPG